MSTDERLAAFLVGDNYQVQEVIGEGAYGIVWSVYTIPLIYIIPSLIIAAPRPTYHRSGGSP